MTATGTATSTELATYLPRSRPAGSRRGRRRHRAAFSVGVVAFAVGIGVGARITRGLGETSTTTHRQVAHRARTKVEGATAQRAPAGAAPSTGSRTTGSRKVASGTPSHPAPSDGAAAAPAPGAVVAPDVGSGTPPVTTAPGSGSETVIGDGVRIVGIGMRPGHWETDGRPGCHWAIYAITGMPQDVDFVDIVVDGNADGHTAVDLTPGQFFETQDCPNWSRVG